MPGNGSVAEPGVVVTAPGSGVIRMPPVSVCHQVSTIGQRFLPIVLRYHIQASGLIGSPTEPSSRSESSEYFVTCSSPQRMKVRIAVGAVYRMVTWYLSMMRQKRSTSGKFGAPSYMTLVAPFDRMPYTTYE